MRIAVDAENGTPLKFTLTPKGGGKPVVEVAYTKVDFGKPAAGTFHFKPPKGTKVTEEKLDGGKFDEHRQVRRAQRARQGRQGHCQAREVGQGLRAPA